MLKYILVFCVLITLVTCDSHKTKKCFHKGLQKGGLCKHRDDCPIEKQLFYKENESDEKCGGKKHYVCCSIEGYIAEKKCDKYKEIYEFVKTKRTPLWHEHSWHHDHFHHHDDDDDDDDDDHEWKFHDFIEDIEDQPKYYFEDGLIWEVHQNYKTYFLEDDTLKQCYNNRFGIFKNDIVKPLSSIEQSTWGTQATQYEQSSISSSPSTGLPVNLVESVFGISSTQSTNTPGTQKLDVNIDQTQASITTIASDVTSQDNKQNRLQDTTAFTKQPPENDTPIAISTESQTTGLMSLTGKRLIPLPLSKSEVGQNDQMPTTEMNSIPLPISTSEVKQNEKNGDVFLSKLLPSGLKPVESKDTKTNSRRKRSKSKKHKESHDEDAREILEGNPHIVSLGYGTKSDIKWECSGTLISEVFILTSAHCTRNLEFGKVKFILLGDDENDNSRIYYVERVFIPKDFHFRYFYNDIALLEITKPAIFSYTSLPACLYDSHNVRTIIDIFESCPTNYFGSESVPLGVDLTSQFCVGKKSNTQNDCDSKRSGSSLSYFQDKVYKVVGVRSFPEKCGNDFPKMYTRVHDFIGWIEDIVWDHWDWD